LLNAKVSDVSNNETSFAGYTFILHAAKQVPKNFGQKEKLEFEFKTSIYGACGEIDNRTSTTTRKDKLILDSAEIKYAENQVGQCSLRALVENSQA
jgi:hypothetical protein